MLRQYVELPRSVHVLCLGTLINRAGSFVLVFLTIYVSQKLGFGIKFATWCMGTFGLGSIVASLVGGQLADQFGRRVVMLIALFGGAVMLLAMSFAQTRPTLLAAIFVYALLSEMYRPAASAMIGDVVTPAQRTLSFGLLYISINLGFAVGPPIGGFLASKSYTLLFVADALTMAAYGLIILLFIPETVGLAQNASGSDEVIDDVPAREAIRHMAADGTFVLFCVASFLMALVFMQAMSTLPIHITNSGYSQFEFGLMISLNGIMIVFLQLPITHALNRYNRMSVILIGGLFIGCGFGLTAFAHALPMYLITIVLWTIGEMMQSPFKHAVVTDLAPPALRGRYMGMSSMCYSLALMIGAPLGGEILQRFGSRNLWVGSFGVAMLAVVGYAIIHPAVSLRAPVPDFDEEEPKLVPVTSEKSDNPYEPVTAGSDDTTSRL